MVSRVNADISHWHVIGGRVAYPMSIEAICRGRGKTIFTHTVLGSHDNLSWGGQETAARACSEKKAKPRHKALIYPASQLVCRRARPTIPGAVAERDPRRAPAVRPRSQVEAPQLPEHLAAQPPELLDVRLGVAGAPQGAEGHGVGANDAAADLDPPPLPTPRPVGDRLEQAISGLDVPHQGGVALCAEDPVGRLPGQVGETVIDSGQSVLVQAIPV